MSDEERLERALQRVADDQSPRAETSDLSAEEQRMVRMAQLLRGSAGQDASPSFVEDLHRRLTEQPRHISRRTAVVSGLGALAAAVAAGFGLGRLTEEQGPVQQTALVSDHGRWYAVAQVADLTEGEVRPFTAGAVQGFLFHSQGRVRAVSRVCTHMGCTLVAQPKEQALVCPCHGAEFDLQGHLRYGPGGAGYRISVPPLPVIQTRVRDKTVEVWGA